MKKYIYFLTGLLCGAVLFSGTAVLANSGVLAQMTSQIFFLNGEQAELFAYNIGGNNYIKLRDAAALFGADIEYIEETNSVCMETEVKGETLTEEPDAVLPQISEISADGTSYSKEDFSANASQSIFGDIYTREAYNAMRQTIADTKSITDGNNADGYNPTYSYAHYVDTEFTFTMDDVLCELRRCGIHVSDRKYFGFTPIVRAKAYLGGNMEVNPKDLLVLKNYFWNKPEEIAAVEKVLTDLCENPIGAEIERILTMASESKSVMEETLSQFESQQADEREKIKPYVVFQKELFRIYLELSNLHNADLGDSENTAITDAENELEKMLVEVQSRFMLRQYLCTNKKD